jgi:nicotinamidase-related amidase
MEPPTPGGRVLDADDSVLCVIDVQRGFVDKLGEADGADRVIQRVVWIAALARVLGIPMVATAEEPDRNGPVLGGVEAQFPEGTPTFVKPVFALADVPEILSAVEATGRRTAVLVGLETDVCVAQSALGLLDRGFRVAAVHDAVASPGAAHPDGLERMRASGVTLVSAKGLCYEWVRTVERAWQLERLMADIPLPDGLTL